MAERSPYYFELPIKYKNKLELIKKAVVLYACVDNTNREESVLENRSITVLSFYILYGYSSETKEKIKDALGINTKYLNQINSELTKGGYLICNTMNRRIKKVCDDLSALGRYFLHKKAIHKEISVVFLQDE